MAHIDSSTGLHLPCIFYPGIEHNCMPLCRCVEMIIRYPVAEVTVMRGFCDVDGVDRGEETSDGSGSSGTNSSHKFMNLSTNPAFFLIHGPFVHGAAAWHIGQLAECD